MTIRILAFLLAFSTLNFSQNLPEAPQPKPVKKHTANFYSPKISANKKALVISGLAAVTAASIILTVDRNKKNFIRACACPAQIPKK